MVGFDLALYLRFESYALVALVLHIPVVVLVDFLYIDGSVFVLDAHESFVFFLELLDDEFGDHLLLQLFFQRLFSLIHLDPVFEFMFLLFELFFLLFPFIVFLLVEFSELFFLLLVVHTLVLFFNLLDPFLFEFLLREYLFVLSVL